MKLTRTILLGIAFLMPAVSTIAKAEDKPAAEGAAGAEGEKKAKKGKKGAKKEGEAAAPAGGEKKPEEKK